MSKAFNNVILESRVKPLITMMKEIMTYMMERWATNRMRFQNFADADVLPNSRREHEKEKHIHKFMACQVIVHEKIVFVIQVLCEYHVLT